MSIQKIPGIPEAHSVQNLLVIGTGTMGAGIAQVAASAGCRVALFDAKAGAAEAALGKIGAALERSVAKGWLEQDRASRALENLRVISSLKEADGTEAVIEAIREDLETKQQLFASLEKTFPLETLFWTNTSMISIRRIAEVLQHPQRMAGTHFFNPVPRMQLVEIIAGEYSSEETLATAEATVRQWGKQPVRAPDSPGFLVNRILDAMLREALALHAEGSSAAAIDEAIRLGLNFPMGPMELMDLIGLDTSRDCIVSMANQAGHQPTGSELLTRLVAEGKLGRKSGEGFYPYPES
jgi:3-hydroxybutyryl-CoA dehydrogenase